MTKRNLVEEILSKQSRLHKRGTRMDLFRRRVHPLVKGFRALINERNSLYKEEWLKYAAIGYVACVEGYFRLLIASIIDKGDPFVSRIGDFKDIRFTPEAVVAIHRKKVSLGHFVAHLLPINGVSDLNAHLSTLLGLDYLKHYMQQPVSEWNSEAIGVVFQTEIGLLEDLFKIRHLYAHELATKEKVSVRKLEDMVGAAAMFVMLTERIVVDGWQIGA